MGRPSVYGFDTMRRGDEIYIEGWNDGTRAQWSAQAFTRRHPHKQFICTMENKNWEDGKPPGVRITRIS